MHLENNTKKTMSKPSLPTINKKMYNEPVDDGNCFYRAED